MKCPLKFRLYPFEGGQECDPECAWRLATIEYGGERAADVCAMAAIGVDGIEFAVVNGEAREENAGRERQ